MSLYEVVYDDVLSQSGLRAIDEATTAYLKAECNVTPTGDDWRDDLELDPDYAGSGQNAHPDADGPVFSSKIAADNYAAYLRDVHIYASVIELS